MYLNFCKRNNVGHFGYLLMATDCILIPLPSSIKGKQRWQSSTSTAKTFLIRVCMPNENSPNLAESPYVRKVVLHTIWTALKGKNSLPQGAYYFLYENFPFEPRHEISNNVVCATGTCSDQPAQTRSLIRAFANHLNILRIVSYMYSPGTI